MVSSDLNNPDGTVKPPIQRKDSLQVTLTPHINISPLKGLHVLNIPPPSPYSI